MVQDFRLLSYQPFHYFISGELSQLVHVTRLTTFGDYDVVTGLFKLVAIRSSAHKVDAAHAIVGDIGRDTL
jgi:hypothetical protein